MGQKIASLEMELSMATGSAVTELNRFGGQVDAVSAQAIRDLDRIDASMKNVGGLDAATASAVRFAEETAKSAVQMARDAERSERSGERVAAQLERQIAVYGLTRSEVRGLRSEEAALDAERNGHHERAARIRALEAELYDKEFAAARRSRQEVEALAEAKDAAAQQAAAAAEREAAALRAEAAAAEVAAREHALLAAAVQGSHAAQMADAEGAERLRVSTDPLYAITKRLNAEIAESTRLYHAGATAPAEYARQQEVLTRRLRDAEQAHIGYEGATRRSGFATKQFALQLPDIVGGLLTGQKPMTVFIQQGGQLAQVAQMAEGGVKGFASEIGGLALRFLPLGAAVAVAGVALYRWKSEIDDDAGLKKYAEGLGLTHKEMKKLGDQSITTGDLVAGVWKTMTEGLDLNGSGKSIMDHLFSPDDAAQVQGFIASIYGFFAGGYDAIVALWGNMSSTVSAYLSAMASAASRFFAPVVSAAEWAGNAVGNVFNTVYQWVEGWVKSIAGYISPVLNAIGKGEAASALNAAGNSLGKTFGDAYSKRVAGFINGSNAFVAKAAANTIDAAEARLKHKADALIADRTPKKPREDHHAEQLAREAEATEAQIRNLYKLADAYNVSGAAALIAEARAKAESKAIKSRADIDAAVERQIRLSIAQRVVDAEKTTAGMRDQAAAQAAVNGLVAAGVVPVERAADLVKDQIADLPLLAAQQVAQGLHNKKAIDDTTAALARQRAARAALRKEEVAATFNADQSAAANQIAMLEAELRLIGATDAARVHELATLKALQEARAKGFDPAQTSAYVGQQVEIADNAERNRQAQNDYNDALTETADRWDIIASKVQSAGQGMAEAFGDAGRAIGDLSSIYANYAADRTRAEVEHAAKVKNLAAGSTALARENELFALRSSGAQIAAYGDMASAAKGFFKEGSDGYKAIAAAEKVYRVAQMAMSLQAMIQNAVETTTSVANAGARATAAGTAGIAEQSKLPFPANIAAMAATGAALVAAGIAVFGGFGGGKNTLPESNTGTGTVLGDPTAQSESVRRGIDALKEVDTLMLTASREMASHLRSIDSQIGGFAAQIVRSGNIDASAGVSEGFQTNVVGSILKAVPLFGNALASLFGTKTTVVGSGLYGGAQTVGNILSDGFDASTYSDVQKKKKFLGITTSTKYSTQYADADDALENQFTLILRGFASAISAAADPLGEATGAVEARLNGFVVNIGKIDLQGLTGAEIQDKLEAVFGAAADGMAEAAFPGIARFQKAGEGAFETLVRVASTLEAVSSSLDMIGNSAAGMSIDVKLGLADQFDSVSDLTSAVDAYFAAYYTDAEQAAAKTAQMGRVFEGLGLAMPATLTSFRQLVEAQDLTTAAGQATYATLLQLAPAFADLQSAMGGAKSAADIAAERQDLERKLLELGGDTAAIRALDLAKLDASNRALQEQVWAVQDAKDAASAAKELRDAWSSVGDSIMDEVKRIRRLADEQTPAGFAALMGQFNTATAAARAGDMDAAKSLPTLSKSLLDAAAKAATSRQELDRVQAEAAASLEATYAAIGGLGTDANGSDTATTTADAMAQAATAATTAVSATASLVAEVRQLRESLEAKLSESIAAQAATAGNTGRIDRRLDDLSAANGGQALSVASAAA